jgi:hypothetical protein
MQLPVGRGTIVAVAVLLLGLSGCASSDLTEEDACRMAQEYIAKPKHRDGWQHYDLDHVPSSVYKNVEFIGCSDFLTKLDENWATIQVEARGDEFGIDDEVFVGRTIFGASLELRRAKDGWAIIDKHVF